jgi:hypothetical protein
VFSFLGNILFHKLSASFCRRVGRVSGRMRRDSLPLFFERLLTQPDAKNTVFKTYVMIPVNDG